MYESAGSVQTCVRIIEPTSTTKLESVYFNLQLSTQSISGKLCS